MSVNLGLAPFYDTFGVLATYTHSTTVKYIQVIFDRAGYVSDVADSGVQNAQPAARCMTADVSSAARGDTLVIDGTTYLEPIFPCGHYTPGQILSVAFTVIRVEPINTLETVLHLSVDS